MNDHERRMPGTKVSDKRLLAWLNEGSVLIALGRNINQPTYVAEIARLAPVLTRSSKKRAMSPKKAAKRKKTGGGTKPGMRAAAERLHKRGILRCIEAVPPNKNTVTPHYSIDPKVDVLAKILRTYGSFVVADLTEAGFAGAVIEVGMDKHLSKVLKVPVKTVRRLAKAEKDELVYLAESSIKAMEILLDPQFELKPVTSLKNGDYDLLAQIRRLRDAMLFAFVAEAVSSPGHRIGDKGWDVEADIDTVVKSGNMSIRITAKFDSKQYVKVRPNPETLHKEHKKRGDAARAKPSS
jgi:hypothetical protein